jgi:hypothetical protein
MAKAGTGIIIGKMVAAPEAALAIQKLLFQSIPEM